jgi:ABC-type branched-subunit amino acid transport system permease subunit
VVIGGWVVLGRGDRRGDRRRVEGLVTAAGYPQYSEAAIYLLMLLVLLVRPRACWASASCASSSPCRNRATSSTPRSRWWPCPSRCTRSGLGVTSATEVVIFAMACMALNILVGYTGLGSFGHGAWFGLAAYAAAILQREDFKGRFRPSPPPRRGRGTGARVGLRLPHPPRRGVYFSLLTLALSAMLYAVAFRWTDVTGGENGLAASCGPP